MVNAERRGAIPGNAAKSVTSPISRRKKLKGRMKMKDVYYKQLPRYPTITLSSNKADEIVSWFKSTNMSPLIPPIYQSFVIKTDGQVYELVHHERMRRRKKVFTTIERCCHVQYNNTKTKLRMTYFDDNIRLLTVDADYQSFSHETRALVLSAEAISTCNARGSGKAIGRLHATCICGAGLHLVPQTRSYRA